MAGEFSLPFATAAVVRVLDIGRLMFAPEDGPTAVEHIINVRPDQKQYDPVEGAFDIGWSTPHTIWKVNAWRETDPDAFNVDAPAPGIPPIADLSKMKPELDIPSFVVRKDAFKPPVVGQSSDIALLWQFADEHVDEIRGIVLTYPSREPEFEFTSSKDSPTLGRFKCKYGYVATLEPAVFLPETA